MTASPSRLRSGPARGREAGMARRAFARPWLIGAVLVLAGLLAWHFMRRAAPPAAPEVSLAAVRAELVPARLQVSGTITPAAQVALTVTQPGTLSAVNVKIGDHVTKGEVLATQNDAMLAANVQSAAAQLEVAQANGAASAKAYHRAASIRDSGAISPEMVDQRGAAAAAQAAQVSAAQANLALARAKLQAAQVVAPMDGVIAAVNAEPGEYAAPGGPPLFTLIGDAGLRLDAPIAQQDLARVKPGMAVRIDLPGGSVTGHVAGVDPQIDANTHLGTVRIDLPDDPALIPGAFIGASIDLPGTRALVIPGSALIADNGGGYHVMVATGDEVQARPVTPATLPGLGAGLIALTGGLQPGDLVVTHHGAALVSGERVRRVD